MQRKTNSHQTNTKSGGIVWANTNMCGIRNANTEAKQLKDAYILQSSYVGGQYPKRRYGGITKFMWLVTINNVVYSQYLMNQLSILTIASETGIWNSLSHVGKGWGTTTRLSAKSLPSKRMVSTLGVPSYFRARTILGTFWLGAHHQPYPSKRHFFKQQW